MILVSTFKESLILIATGIPYTNTCQIKFYSAWLNKFHKRIMFDCTLHNLSETFYIAVKHCTFMKKTFLKADNSLLMTEKYVRVVQKPSFLSN